MMNYFQNLLGNYQFNASHLAIGAGVLVVIYFLWTYMRGSSEEDLMVQGGPYPDMGYGPGSGGPGGPGGPGQGAPGGALPPMPVPQANDTQTGGADYPGHQAAPTQVQPVQPVQPQGEYVGGGSNRTLVLYYAPWCTYCKQLMPTWDALSEKYGKRMQKVDCDQFPDESEKQNIEVFPTMILFIDGKQAQALKGNADAETIEQLLA